MKKTYESPKIIFSDFTLSTSIASTCTIISNNEYRTCPITIGDDGLTVFSDVNTCVVTGQGGGSDLCYQAPGDNTNVFSS